MGRGAQALNAHFHTDVMCTIILVVTQAQVSSAVADILIRGQIMQDVARVVQNNPPKPMNPAPCIGLVLEKVQPSVGEAAATTLRNLLAKHLKRDDGVYRHMLGKFRMRWLQIVDFGGMQQQQQQQQAGGIRFPAIAGDLVKKSEGHAMEFCRVVVLSAKVHGTTYDGIINTALQQGVAIVGQQQQQGN